MIRSFIDINAEDAETDNRDLGETWVTYPDGTTYRISLTFALWLLENALENADQSDPAVQRAQSDLIHFRNNYEATGVEQ